MLTALLILLALFSTAATSACTDDARFVNQACGISLLHAAAAGIGDVPAMLMIVDNETVNSRISGGRL